MAWSQETNIKGPPGKDGASDWSQITGKPATFPPTVPIAQSDVTNLVADQAAQDAAIALKAPVASPTFTGDPKAPTPTAGDSDTSIATTAFVTGAVSTATVPPATAPPLMDGAAAVGTVAKYAKEDHRHPTDTSREPSISGGTTSQFWRGDKSWQPIAIPPGTTVSDTPPGSPVAGALWFESDSGNLYIWYADANSSQWVQVSAPPSPAAQRTAETRNRIVNGAMQISQENGNTVGTVSPYYPADQWFTTFVSSSTINALRSSGSTNPNGIIGLSAVPAETSAAATEQVNFVQRLEGIRLYDFFFGTASSVQAVLAFDVNVPVAGTYWVSFTNGSGTHTFLGSYAISAGEAATWVRKTVVIPAGAINAGTWATDNTVGATLRFCFHCGSNSVGVAGFQTGDLRAGPGQALGLSTAAGCFITNVGFYRDLDAAGLAPKWAMPDEAQELAACQRYWYKLFYNHIFTATAAGQFFGMTAAFPSQMRTAPAVSLIGGGSASNCNAFIDMANVASCRTYITAAAAGAATLNAYAAVANARM